MHVDISFLLQLLQLQQNMSTESSSSLPVDLLIEILLCLPVKTLLRFKSVSKSWLAIIDGSDFIHLHATTTTDNTSSSSSSMLGTFIFQSKRHVSLNRPVSWNIFSISSGDHEFEVFEDLTIPPCYRDPRYWKDDLIFMVGSCNGVICLQDDKLSDVSLWNPAIHQFRLLPKSLIFNRSIGNGKVYTDFIAFGFDVETKDYKVVLVTYFYPTDQVGSMDYNNPTKYPHRVQVYSLSTDSWRTLEHLVMPIHPRPLLAGGGYLNGSYYCLGWKWIGTDQALVKEEEVLSFDFAKEIFKTMQLPDGINNNMGVPLSGLSIIFLGGKFAVIDHHMSQNTYDFWVLNEVGVKEEENWTKLYTIGPYHTHEWPIGISNNGEFIFMVTSNGETLWLLNPSTQVMKKLLRDDGNQIMRADLYRGSLVPVCSKRNGSISTKPSFFDT